MKYLSLTLMFCFLAFFSCEREDAFPETHGPAEPLAEHESTATNAYADMAELSALIQDQFKDPSTVTEEDVVKIAAKADIDLVAIGQSYYNEFTTLKDRGLNDEEASIVMARDQAVFIGLTPDKATPCFDSFINTTAGINAAAVICATVAVITVNPVAAGGCAAAQAAASAIAETNFKDCIRNTYPNQAP